MKPTEQVEYLSPNAAPEYKRRGQDRGITTALRNLPAGQVGRFPLSLWPTRHGGCNALFAAAKYVGRPIRTWTDSEYIYFADKETTS